jgi:hypothetical protein
MQAHWDTYKDQGLVVVTLLAEDMESQSADQTDLQTWAEQFGLTHPVLADTGWGIGNRFEQDFGIPSVTLLKPGLVVHSVDQASVTTADIEAILPAAQ